MEGHLLRAKARSILRRPISAEGQKALAAMEAIYSFVCESVDEKTSTFLAVREIVLRPIEIGPPFGLPRQRPGGDVFIRHLADGPARDEKVRGRETVEQVLLKFVGALPKSRWRRTLAPGFWRVHGHMPTPRAAVRVGP